MPEGDTIFRTAATLRASLVGRTVTRARAQPGPALRRVPDLSPLVGTRVSTVDARGKHLLIGFENGLTLRTHLRMRGSWHRYAPGQPWRRSARHAAVTIETPDVVAVCFDAPVAELLTARELARSPALASLGPDPLGDDFDADAAVGRLASRPELEIAEALIDQGLLAGVGNVYKSEVCFLERIHPWATVSSLDRVTLHRLVTTAQRLLQENSARGPRVTTGRSALGARLWVYARAGRPCRRCGTRIQARRQGSLARLTYWCSKCQSSGKAVDATVTRRCGSSVLRPRSG